MKKSARKNLINLRQQKRLTQTETALKLKISLRQYQALEAGTSDGSVRVWQQLKELLNAESIDYLLAQKTMDNTKEPDGNRA